MCQKDTDLSKLYAQHFSLGFLSNDIQEKFAIISLTCYLKSKCKNKTYYSLLKYITKDKLDDKFVLALSIVCEDFGYGCTEFPTFGLSDKEIPKKLQELLYKRLPF